MPDPDHQPDPLTSAAYSTDDASERDEAPQPHDSPITVTPGGGHGTLYVVATPIGNLSDLGQRASETLRDVSWVAAEDTRVSRVLLDRIGAKTRTLTVHQHNEERSSTSLIERLRQGDDVALITDAGTPAISDPGSLIVASAHAQGFRVVPVPGASAPIALLSAAGLPPSPFLFEGFLPPKDKARDERLRWLRRHADALGAHVVLFEAPHRIERTLAAIAVSHGAARLLVIGRELTKKFEQIVRLEAGAAQDWLAARPEHRRGEFVVAIGALTRTTTDDSRNATTTADNAGNAPEHPLADSASEASAGLPGTASPASGEGLESEIVDWPARASGLNTARALLERLLRDLPTSRAVRLAEELTGQPHKALYSLALSLKRDDS